MLLKKADMFHRFFVLFLVGFILVSCKEKSVEKTIESSAEEVVEIEGDFVKFYNRFHKDSAFQWNHVAFPMENMANDSIGEYWTEENWIMHNAFSDMGGMFKRDINPIGKSLVVEKIVDANGFFDMERRFSKSKDEWNLIFYSVENPAFN